MQLHPNASSALVETHPTTGRTPNLIPMRPSRPDAKITFTFSVYRDHAPALRSAIDEISNDIGGRLTGSHKFAKEGALTDAAIALAVLRKEVFSKVAEGDPNYA